MLNIFIQIQLLKSSSVSHKAILFIITVMLKESHSNNIINSKNLFKSYKRSLKLSRQLQVKSNVLNFVRPAPENEKCTINFPLDSPHSQFAPLTSFCPLSVRLFHSTFLLRITSFSLNRFSSVQRAKCFNLVRSMQFCILKISAFPKSI